MADSNSDEEKTVSPTPRPIRSKQRRGRKHFTGECLTRKDGTPIQEGDVLVAQMQYSGCTCLHLFVQIVRITHSKYLRVRHVLKKSQPLESDAWGSNTQVWPDLTQRLDDYTFLLRPHGGWGGWGSILTHDYTLYRHYTEDETIVDQEVNEDLPVNSVSR